MTAAPTPDLDELLQAGYGFALSLTADPERARDLVQEACVRVVRGDHPWHKSYLFTTIRNRFIDEHRRAKLVTIEPLDDAQLAQIQDGEAWVEDLAGRLATREQMAEAFDQLRPEEREVLHLAWVEDYTAREVAEVTGRPRGTVLSLVHRARRKLEGFLERKQRREGAA